MFKTSNSIAAMMLVVASIGFPAAVSASDYDDVFRERYDSPEDVGVLGRFVSKAVEVGQYDQAISTLEQHLVKYPRDARARLNLASVYSNTGSWELAARNLEIALSVGDLTPEETKQAEELAAKVNGALSGFEWVLDMTVGIRSKWLDVEDSNNSWKDRQDWNPFAAVSTALKIDLDTPLNDVLVVSASGLVERRYEDINQGGDDPFTAPFEFNGIGGIYAHHRGRIAVTLDKGVPVVELDAVRIQMSAFGQFRTYNPSVTEVALGTSVRAIVQPSVDTSFYGEVSYANLGQSTNLSSEHRFGAEAGASKRLTAEHTIGMAARYQREITDGGTTVNRLREVELSYAGVLPYQVFGALWTHQVAGAFGDFVSRDGNVNPAFASAGTGTYWRASWDHAFHLDGYNRINVGYLVRENEYDGIGPFDFDPGSMSHTLSMSFTKSF
ncbi:MAG: tetratricopeptide repeat protein [Anderseniella sp.]